MYLSSVFLQGEQAAKADALVTFGIPAKSPETGYGYIEAGDFAGAAAKVLSFKEKPDEGRQKNM